MHVRSFTRHPSSGVRYGGTYEGILEKIPYLSEFINNGEKEDNNEGNKE